MKGGKLSFLDSFSIFELICFHICTNFIEKPIVIQYYVQHGLHATFCDQDGSLWASGLGSWATIFYVSDFHWIPCNIF